VSRATLKYALFIGLALTGTYIFYGYGLPRTSISNAAFVCALPVVFTPLFGWLIYRKPLGKKAQAVSFAVRGGSCHADPAGRSAHGLRRYHLSGHARLLRH